jgi:hypothetical protein
MMEMFVVYERPRDYPDRFVLRRWSIGGNKMEADRDWFYLGDTLKEVREKVPPHCVCIRRHTNDEPQIVEVWI